ncbi:MAG: HEPN domain-containing protein [Actinomycetota bacterium]
MNRYRDWLDQAGANLLHAERSVEMGDYAWACFAAQQAAEAALKALHMRHGQVAWGHSVLDLISALPEEARPGRSLEEKARTLDKYYIPTRYPDAHPAGSAARHYTEDEARQAVEMAREVISHCERESLEA